MDLRFQISPWDEQSIILSTQNTVTNTCHTPAVCVALSCIVLIPNIVCLLKTTKKEKKRSITLCTLLILKFLILKKKSCCLVKLCHKSKVLDDSVSNTSLKSNLTQPKNLFFADLKCFN